MKYRIRDIRDCLTPKQFWQRLSLSVNTLIAINTSHKLKTTKKRVVELEKELEKAISFIPEKEMDAFTKSITN